MKKIFVIFIFCLLGLSFSKLLLSIRGGDRIKFPINHYYNKYPNVSNQEPSVFPNCKPNSQNQHRKVFSQRQPVCLCSRSEILQTNHILLIQIGPLLCHSLHVCKKQKTICQHVPRFFKEIAVIWHKHQTASSRPCRY